MSKARNIFNCATRWRSTTWADFGVTVLRRKDRSLIKDEPLEAAALTNHLAKDSKYPLHLRRRLRARSLHAPEWEPLLSRPRWPSARQATQDLAREFGRISALESRAIGVQWNWFPVADVNSNPANPIIDTRSFGEDPALVSEMVDAYIEGARRGRLADHGQTFSGTWRHGHGFASSLARASMGDHGSSQHRRTGSVSERDCRWSRFGDGRPSASCRPSSPIRIAPPASLRR